MFQIQLYMLILLQYILRQQGNKKSRMKIAFLTLATLLLLVSKVAAEERQCQPYYPRIFWNPDSEEISSDSIDHIFMWNTNSSCPYSFIKITYQTHTHKFRCQQTKLQTLNDDQTVQFEHYVHKCYALIIENHEIGTFSYQLFGSKYIDEDSAVPSDVFQVQMPKNDLALRFAVISDWGPIIVKPYKPLNDTLDYILAKRQQQKSAGSDTEWRINGLILNGDYAYNLQTDHCQMYLLFLNEISRITRFWPMLTNVGNHESTLPKSMYLFENSFVIGRLSTADGVYTRVQSYRFVNRTTFIFFDPFLEIYKIGTPAQYQVMKSSIIAELYKARDLYPDEFRVMASHYPVMCSQVDPHCRDAMGNMPDLYEYLSRQFEGKGLVDLYIGSHMHQYQRIWPFVENRFVNESSPYYRGRLASFVEAVAGVNYWIIENYYQPEYFSVYSTYNITGMGIMTFEGRSNSPQNQFAIRYKHIITPNTYEEVDSFVVTNKYKETSSGHLKQE